MAMAAMPWTLRTFHVEYIGVLEGEGVSVDGRVLNAMIPTSKVGFAARGSEASMKWSECFFLPVFWLHWVAVAEQSEVETSNSTRTI